MTIATVLCFSLLFAFVPSPKAPLIACNLKAIGKNERPRYNDLIKRLRAAVRNRHAVPDGYIYQIENRAITLPEVAEWMSMERLCCPFLSLQLSAAGKRTDWLLTLTGPPGTKTLLDAEFPAHE